MTIEKCIRGMRDMVSLAYPILTGAGERVEDVRLYKNLYPCNIVSYSEMEYKDPLNRKVHACSCTPNCGAVRPP